MPEVLKRYDLWLRENGYPEMEIRVDASNFDISKKLIQGVSGVGGDLMSLLSGEMHYLQAVGVLSDLTEVGVGMGFGPEKTYAGVRGDFTVDDRQYGYPKNVGMVQLWINKATFEKYGQPIPPRRWTVEQFEQMGEAFVRAANPEGARDRVFYSSAVRRDYLYRGLGLSIYNETMTRCTLDDERYVSALRRAHKWIFDLRLVPSPADLEAFAADAGFLGLRPQLFNSGQYAMITAGRYALVGLRQFDRLELEVAEHPHTGFPNAALVGGPVGIYAGSEKKELAAYFLKFLASEAYNTQLVEDGHGIPPNPRFANTEAFLHPPEFQNEWGLHEFFIRSAETVGIGLSISPFVLPHVASRIERSNYEAFLAGRLSADETASDTSRRINSEIERYLERYPEKQVAYKSLVNRQEEIGRRRASGELVPLDWITNPFHRKYYLYRGWARE